MKWDGTKIPESLALPNTMNKALPEVWQAIQQLSIKLRHQTRGKKPGWAMLTMTKESGRGGRGEKMLYSPMPSGFALKPSIISGSTTFLLLSSLAAARVRTCAKVSASTKS